MANLVIRKKSSLVWVHEPSDQYNFIIGKFTFSIDGNDFQIIELGQSKRNKYAYTNITIIDDTTSTTYANFSSAFALSNKLSDLGYIGFNTAITIVTGSFAKVVQWDGNTITVTTGYAGTVFNQSTSQFCTYTMSGAILTITANATAQDILIITSN